MKQEKYSSSKSVFKLIANILSWTALALLLVIAAFLLYLTISSKIYAAKGADYEPKFSLYTIISPSMEPNLRVYDIIVDQRIDSVNDIQIGDIITFISTSSISSNKTVTHRVIDIVIDENGNYQYKTKGDNNLSPDSAYAEYNNIIGKVLFKIPQLGRIQFFLANQGGWLVVVVIPAIIIIVKDIMKIFKLAKVNKKAEVVVEGKKQEDDEERKKRKEEEEERKKRLKERLKKNSDDTIDEENTQSINVEQEEEIIAYEEPSNNSLFEETQTDFVVSETNEMDEPTEEYYVDSNLDSNDQLADYEIEDNMEDTSVISDYKDFDVINNPEADEKINEETNFESFNNESSIDYNKELEKVEDEDTKKDFIENNYHIPSYIEFELPKLKSEVTNSESTSEVDKQEDIKQDIQITNNSENHIKKSNEPYKNHQNKQKNGNNNHKKSNKKKNNHRKNNSNKNKK